MREHKYRAWDKRDKKYWYLLGFIKQGSEVRIWWKLSDDVVMNKSFNEHNIILEEYTGLKDIFSNQDCYENDLIDWFDSNKDKIVRFKVVFEDGCFYGERLDSPNMRYQLSILLHRTMHSEAGKIVGTIHDKVIV